MKKGLIAYSSQNGSTRKIAENITAGLRQNGVLVDLIHVDNTADVPQDRYDFYGFGAPVYMFRPSYKIMDIIDTMENLSDKPAFTFVTYGTEIGDGANWLRRKIAGKGALDLGHFQCTGRDLFPGYTSKGYLFSPESPSNEDVSAARSFGDFVAAQLLTNEIAQPNPVNKRIHPVLQFERFATNRFFIKRIYRYFFKVQKTKCTSCGTCVDSCPTGNISMSSEQHPEWGGDCILCCNCQIQCPTEAIETPISWFVFMPFLWFNIYLSKQKNIQFADVKKSG